MSINNISIKGPSSNASRASIGSIDYSSSANTLYFANSSNLWQSIDTESLCIYRHNTLLTALKLSPSEELIAFGDNNGNVYILNLASKNIIFQKTILAAKINSISWSPDSKRIVAVGNGRNIFGGAALISSGSGLGEISGHSKNVLSCDWKPTTPYQVVTASEDSSIASFNVPPLRFKNASNSFTKMVNCVAYKHDGSVFLAGSSDKTLRVFDGETAEYLYTFPTTHKLSILSIAWCKDADSSLFVTTSSDKTVKLYDFNSQKLLSEVIIGDNVGDMGSCLVWNGDSIKLLSSNGFIHTLSYENNTLTIRDTLIGHQKPIIASVAYKNDIFTVDWSGRIIKSSADSNHVHIPSFEIYASGMVVVNDQLLVSLSSSVLIFDLDLNFIEEQSFDDPIQTIASSRDHCNLIVVTRKSILVNGIEVAPAVNQILAAAISSNPEIFAVAAGSNIYFYNSGETIKVDTIHQKICSLDFNSDFKLVSSDSIKRIILWDNCEPIITGWDYHTGKVSQVSWSTDNQHIASVGIDGTISIWDSEKLRSRIYILAAHEGPIHTLSWIDANTIVTSGDDASVKKWVINY